MKIVGFSQLHDERRKGNLKPWLRSMFTVCDEIFIVDQASTDGSREVYEATPNVVVTYNEYNGFKDQLLDKQALLERIQHERPDTDYIYWMDGDTILDARCTREVLERALKQRSRKLTGYTLGHLNLWRNTTHFRTDSQFHALNKHGRRCFWPLTQGLRFPSHSGPHHQSEPNGVERWDRLDFFQIHLGFVRDEDIVEKLKTYRSIEDPELFAARTYQRFFDEDDLSLEPLPEGVWPEWLEIHRELPSRKIRSVWEDAQ